MTNKEIDVAYTGLRGLQDNASLRFPASVAYAIVRNIRILEPIAADISRTRLSYLLQYGEPSEQLGYYVAKPGQEDTLHKVLDELSEVDNDINIYTIPMSALDGLDLSVNDMDALFFMVDG